MSVDILTVPAATLHSQVAHRRRQILVQYLNGNCDAILTQLAQTDLTGLRAQGGVIPMQFKSGA